jgi:DNA-directed RNA polymerase subunit E"
MKYACRDCHRLTPQEVCAKCKSTNVTDDWSGVVVILDPNKSNISQSLKIKTEGLYALKVR